VCFVQPRSDRIGRESRWLPSENAWILVPSPKKSSRPPRKFSENPLYDVPEPSEPRPYTCGTPFKTSMRRKVRARPIEQGGRIPAAALTAYTGTEDRKRALRAGYQIHVPKPIEPAELVTVVASLAGRIEKPTK